MGISKAARAKARRDGAAHFEAGLPICNNAFDELARDYPDVCNRATIRAAYEGGWRAAAEAAASKRRQEGDELREEIEDGFPAAESVAIPEPHASPVELVSELELMASWAAALEQAAIEAELIIGTIKTEARTLRLKIAAVSRLAPGPPSNVKRTAT